MIMSRVDNTSVHVWDSCTNEKGRVAQWKGRKDRGVQGMAKRAEGYNISGPGCSAPLLFWSSWNTDINLI